MTDFFLTGMGRKFYDADVPNIARALTRIATSLEQLCKRDDVLDVVTRARSVIETSEGADEHAELIGALARVEDSFK